jgi:hypothetical protein
VTDDVAHTAHPGTDRRREVLRIAAALVLALVGGAVALMAPSALTPGSDGSAAVVWRVGAVGGVVALALVVGGAVARLGRRDGDGWLRAAVVVGWLTVLWLVLGGLYSVLQGVPAGDAVGVGFIVAVPAAAAVVLALVGGARRPVA